MGSRFVWPAGIESVAAVNESGRVGVGHSEKIWWDKVTDNNTPLVHCKILPWLKSPRINRSEISYTGVAVSVAGKIRRKQLSGGDLWTSGLSSMVHSAGPSS